MGVVTWLCKLHYGSLRVWLHSCNGYAGLCTCRVGGYQVTTNISSFQSYYYSQWLSLHVYFAVKLCSRLCVCVCVCTSDDKGWVHSYYWLVPRVMNKPLHGWPDTWSLELAAYVFDHTLWPYPHTRLVHSWLEKAQDGHVMFYYTEHCTVIMAGVLVCVYL